LRGLRQFERREVLEERGTNDAMPEREYFVGLRYGCW
jgi:hypothetical protein